jgi:hypothetical protein
MKTLTMTLAVFALLVAMPVSAAGISVKKSKEAKVDYACLSTAVGVREDAMADAASAYGTAMSALYADRATALKAAYSSGSSVKEIKDDLKSIWKEFRTDAKAERKDWRKARISAWKEFKADAKECKGASGASDADMVKEDVDEI